MAGKLAQILATKADLVDGRIPVTQIPQEVMGAGMKITFSPTPPSNPQNDEVWIKISQT